MRIDGAVVRCPAAAPDLADAPHAGVLCRAGPRGFLFDVPRVARYLVSEGNLVDIEPCAGADDLQVRRFLRTTPAVALYLQRGMPVLHAAVAVSPAGDAVVLAGDSGAGKSVLLTALLQRGWGLLTDDLAPLTLGRNRVPVAVPTWPEVRLWPGCAMRAVYPESGLDDVFIGEPRPVKAIWWLGVHGFDPIEIKSVEGLSRFEALGAMAYNGRIASALLDRSGYLAVAGAVADSGIPILRLIRPRGRWTAGQLADLIGDGATG